MVLIMAIDSSSDIGPSGRGDPHKTAQQICATADATISVLDGTDSSRKRNSTAVSIRLCCLGSENTLLTHKRLNTIAL